MLAFPASSSVFCSTSTIFRKPLHSLWTLQKQFRFWHAMSHPPINPPPLVPTKVKLSHTNADYVPRYVDIGINLTDPQFTGVYNKRKVHEDDFVDVMKRAQSVGVQKLIVTGSDLSESLKGIELAKKYPSVIYSTVGVHPCSVPKIYNDPEGPSDYLRQIRELALKGKETGHVVAFGEIGLDYDRLQHCPDDKQRLYFDEQLTIAEEVGLPLFLHSRAAAKDFERLLFPKLKMLRGGVVHSFTGSLDEMKRLVEMGLYIGVNGCSLKKEENLRVVSEIPLDRLMLETDGPWCEIRRSHDSDKHLSFVNALPKELKKEKFHSGFRVKGRNEPCALPQVAHVVASVKGTTLEEICEAAWKNTVDLFGLGLPTNEEGGKGKAVEDEYSTHS